MFTALGGRLALLSLLVCTACAAPPPRPPTAAQARNLVIITIDTLRADRVGAYGYVRARTPHIDSLAARGVRFEHAYATAPITLSSHASLMTGRYPPGHGARHNGMRVDSTVPSLAKTLSQAGFATGAFVSAFPLDRRFGLNAGFAAYGDRMPRGSRGRPENERPGHAAVDEALAWLSAHRTGRVFLWVHLFEPHAPYGDPRSGRPVADRYDDEIAESDAQVGRVIDALGADAASTLIVVASDHGESFGEHGEVSHSLFVYDTTLRVPLVMAGPGVASRAVGAPVSLVDVAPTVLPLLGMTAFDSDGVDLSHTFAGVELPARDLYAESFAPLLDFGWSPLRSVRSEGFKFIDAPRPELYDLTRDSGEVQDLSGKDPRRGAALHERVNRYSTSTLNANRSEPLDGEALSRLQSLGYAAGSAAGGSSGARPDPKDRRAIAARLSEVISGELQGKTLETALGRILADDPKNPQANLRLGFVLLESNRCAEATPYLAAAVAARMPTADAHLGLGMCQARARRLDDAQRTLREAERVEPDNPVVLANLGIVLSDAGRHADAIAPLQRALALDPDFHEARFNLARVFARAGQREAAGREAQALLTRLPANAPQRAEVQRLLDAVR